QEDHSSRTGATSRVVEDEGGGGKLVSPLVVIARRGFFRGRPPPDVIALKPASYAKDVQCPARRWQSGRVPGVAKGRQRHLPHRREVGANKAHQPYAVIG